MPAAICPVSPDAHQAAVCDVIAAITGRSFADRAALSRALSADDAAALHRSILIWLQLSPPMRPMPLRRVPRRGRASPRATRALVSSLAIVARAYLLFADMDVVRRWLARPAVWDLRFAPAFPLAALDRPQGRRQIASAMRRTAHGLL